MAKKSATKKAPEAKSATQNYAGVWDNRVGFGKKAAVIVIDLLQGYTLPGAPLFAPGVVKCVKEVPELPSMDRDHMWLKMDELLSWRPQSDVAKPYPPKPGAVPSTIVVTPVKAETTARSDVGVRT